MTAYPALFPDPATFDLIAVDTETTGVHYNSVPVGMSFALPGGASAYNGWGQQGGGNNCTLAQVQNWMRDFRPGTVVVMHNALFDLRMLYNVGVDLVQQGCIIVDTGFAAAVHYELEPSFSLGALSQRRLGVPSKSDDALNEYCAQHFGGPPTREAQAKNYWRVPLPVIYEYAVDDAKLTLALWQWYDQHMNAESRRVLDTIEHPLIPVLARMYRRGVRVNVEQAALHADRLQSEIDVLLETWNRETGGVPVVGPGSQVGLRKVWTDAGLPHDLTKTGLVSVTKKHLAEAKGHIIADTLAGLREREKILGTFLKSYILDGSINGRIHTTLHPLRNDEFGAVSGRFSSSDPNLQNLPAPDRDDKTRPVQDQYGRLIRTLVLPEEGSEWVKADYSQIEYRYFAHYAGGQIRQAYLDDPNVDFHQFCADTAGVARPTAKNGNFAKLYGAGIGRLAATLGVSVAEAKRFMTEYDAKIPEAAELYQQAMLRAKRRGWIMTWGGRKRHFRRGERGFEKTHSALNALLQGSSADLTKLAMIAIDRELIDDSNTFMHLCVHDEVDFSAPKGEAGLKFARRVKELMQDFELSVPIIADLERGPNWGDLSDYELD